MSQPQPLDVEKLMRKRILTPLERVRVQLQRALREADVQVKIGLTTCEQIQITINMVDNIIRQQRIAKMKKNGEKKRSHKA